MKVSFSALCALLPLLVSCVVESKVVLNADGHYENLVVKIDDQVTDLTFLTKLQVLFTTFSAYLYTKTNKTVSFKNIQIILPDNNAQVPEKIRATLEPLEDESLPNAASIEIGLPPGPHISTPYTVHLGGCGQEGHHIFLPTDIVNDLSKGMSLVHEWAHYRWGVFDEYAVEGEDVAPFYLTADKKISPTGCPSTLQGWVATKNFSKCSLSRDGLPDPHCMFYFDTHQPDANIMMGYQKMDHFCADSADLKTHVRSPGPFSFHLLPHNDKFDTIHNRKCGHKSAWTVMQQHPDFHHRTTASSRGKAKVQFLRRIGTRSSKVDFLVIKDKLPENDVHKLIHALKCLKFYAELASLSVDIQEIETKQDKNISITLGELTGNSSITVYTEGGYSSNMNKQDSEKGELTGNSEIFVFSDKKFSQVQSRNGEDIGVKYVRSPSSNRNEQDSEKVIEVSLDLDVSELTELLCDKIIGILLPTKQIPVTVYKTRITDPKKETRQFYLDSSCERAMMLSIDSSNEGHRWTINISGPAMPDCLNEDTGDCKVLHRNPSLFVVEIDSSRPNATGYWSYTLSKLPPSQPPQTPHEATETKNSTNLTVFVKCLPSKEQKQNIRIITLDQQSSFNGSSLNEKVVLRVRLDENRRPVLYANVSAIIVSDSGTEIKEKLFDTGLGPDSKKDDGIYSAEFFKFESSGVYSFIYQVVATKATKAILQVNRFTHGKNGVRKLLGGSPQFSLLGTRAPNPLTLTSPQRNLLELTYGKSRSNFSLSDFELLKIEENEETELVLTQVEEQVRFSRPSSPLPVDSVTTEDMISPGKVKDLQVVEISYQKGTVTLEWTSAGDDSYYGTAHKIDLRYSNDLVFYPSRFTEGTPVDHTSLRRDSTLTPKMANEKHRITLSVPKGDSLYPENLIFFYAMVIHDKVNHQSEVSNLATAFFKPEKYSKELQELKQKSTHGTMTILVFCFFVVGILVFIFGIRTFHKMRATRRSWNT